MAVLCLFFLARPGFAGSAGSVRADDTDEKAVQLELNNARQNGGECRVSFLIANRMGGEIEELSLEIVVFDEGGFANKFLLLNTGRLPPDKSLVRQFDLADQSCAKVSRILINGVSACKGADYTAGRCLDALRTSSRVKIKFGL